MAPLILAFGIVLLLSGLLYTGLILFFTYGWYQHDKQRKAIPAGHFPKVSVIIAARNEEKNIANLLEDLMVQDYPKDLTEIIVVDDRSYDNTAGIVTGFIASKGLRGISMVKTDEKSGEGKKQALTLGVSISKGELILVTDADCRVEPGWISILAAYFHDKEKMMVFGPVSYIPAGGIMAGFQSLEFLGLMASGAGAAMAGHPFMCNGANLAYRKSAFLQVQGYKGAEGFISGDDVFLMHKIKKVYDCKAIVFSKIEGALVKTYPVKGLMAFLDQRVRWASKSKGYRDVMALGTSLTVFAFNFILAVVFFTGFYHAGFFLLFAGFLILKSLADLPLMWKVTGFTRSRKIMKWYLPFQAVYPFYITVAGILSLFKRKKW